MNENYIVINGKKSELTDKQLKALGIEVRKSLFDKVTDGGSYYFINCGSEVLENSREDDLLFNSVNYFNDKSFAEQVALHQLLYRKLLKFVYCNRYEDNKPWDCSHRHWSIQYNARILDFEPFSWDTFKLSPVYFSSEKGAERAIKEVVEPFMKKHPEFVW